MGAADWLHVRPTLRRSCLSSQGQGQPETFRLALELRLLDPPRSAICPRRSRLLSLFLVPWPIPVLLTMGLALLTPDTCKAHAQDSHTRKQQFSTANSQQLAASTRGAHTHTHRHFAGKQGTLCFVSMSPLQCPLLCFPPLVPLTFRRGRLRSTSPDSLSFNARCRVSHVLWSQSSQAHQTNRTNKQPYRTIPYRTAK